MVSLTFIRTGCTSSDWAAMYSSILEGLLPQEWFWFVFLNSLPHFGHIHILFTPQQFHFSFAGFGSFTGMIMGGCMDTLCKLIGTPYIHSRYFADVLYHSCRLFTAELPTRREQPWHCCGQSASSVSRKHQLPFALIPTKLNQAF